MLKLDKKLIRKNYEAYNNVQMSVCSSCSCSRCGNGSPTPSTCKGCYDSDLGSAETQKTYDIFS